MKDDTKKFRKIALSGDEEMKKTFKNEVKVATLKRLEKIEGKKKEIKKGKEIRERKGKSYKKLLA